MDVVSQRGLHLGVSAYPWGWAPERYGSWTYLNNYGWFWRPGNSWAGWNTGPNILHPPAQFNLPKPPATPGQILTVNRGPLASPPASSKTGFNSAMGQPVWALREEVFATWARPPARLNARRSLQELCMRHRAYRQRACRRLPGCRPRMVDPCHEAAPTSVQRVLGEVERRRGRQPQAPKARFIDRSVPRDWVAGQAPRSPGSSKML